MTATKSVFAGERVYILGPMTLVGPKGQWNFPAFRRAKLMIDASGGFGVCPALVDKAVWGFNGKGPLVPGMCHEAIMPIDLAILQTCTMGYALRGWELSGGGLAEAALLQCYKRKIVYQPGALAARVGAVVPEEVLV